MPKNGWSKRSNWSNWISDWTSGLLGLDLLAEREAEGTVTWSQIRGWTYLCPPGGSVEMSWNSHGSKIPKTSKNGDATFVVLQGHISVGNQGVDELFNKSSSQLGLPFREPNRSWQEKTNPVVGGGHTKMPNCKHVCFKSYDDISLSVDGSVVPQISISGRLREPPE